jgi:hypothetical protein
MKPTTTTGRKLLRQKRNQRHRERRAKHTGEGYYFHSTPVSEEAEEKTPATNGNENRIFVESKPREQQEVRLTNARFTLERIPASIIDQYQQLAAPRMTRPSTRQSSLPEYGQRPRKNQEEEWEKRSG